MTTNKYLEKIATALDVMNNKRQVLPIEEDYQKHAPKSTKTARGLMLGTAGLGVGSIAAEMAGKPRLALGLGAGAVGTYIGGLGTAIHAGLKTSKAVNKKFKVVERKDQD